jgi:hypothetical protein
VVITDMKKRSKPVLLESRDGAIAGFREFPQGIKGKYKMVYHWGKERGGGQLYTFQNPRGLFRGTVKGEKKIQKRP